MADQPNSPAVDPSAIETADPYADHAAIKDLIRRKRDEWSKGRESVVRAAWRNMLFLRGIQWIRWDRGISRWRPSRLPKNTPTPVTNVYAAAMDAVSSVFGRVEPTLNFRPGNPDEPEDRATADVAVRAIQCIEDETKIRLARQILAGWVTHTGGAWLESGYDPDPIHGMRTLEVDKCQSCGAMQPQAAPMGGEMAGGMMDGAMGGQMGPEMMGQMPAQPMCEACGGQTAPSSEQVPIGKQYVDVVSIFEMYFDPACSDWTKQRAYLREKSVSLDEAKGRWPDLAEGLAPNVMAGTDDWYTDALATLGPAVDENGGPRIGTGAGRMVNTRVTEQWYWQMPDKTYPDGLLAIVVAKNQVGYAGPLPYGAKTADGGRQPFLPFVFFPQKLVPGSMFTKTVADDVAAKQIQRNQWESIIQACGMRVGSPVWLKPAGSNVRNMSGEPGQIIEYNSLGPGSAKPERIPGQGIPLSFIQMIERCDKDIENLAATYDVIKGARPEGVSAGIALQILQERGMSRYGPLFILWEFSWSEWARQALEIFREFATEERLLRIKGRDGQWQVEKFIGADLQGRVDVVPEAGSSMPRSSLVDRAEMEQLVAIGVLPPPRTDPELQLKFLETYGRTNLTPSMAADTKNAIMENEAFRALAEDQTLAQATADDVAAAQEMDYPTLLAVLEQKFGVKIPRVRAAIDDHAIHSREHGIAAKGESFQSLPLIVQVLHESHKAYHDQLRIQQMMAVQQAQGGQPQGNPQGGFMAQPPARTQIMNTSSSPERMGGDMAEMERDMAAPTGP